MPMKKILAILFSLVLCCSVFAQQQAKRYAVVDVAVNYMREDPDYAAENGDQSLMGTVVEVLDKDSYWVKIRTGEPYTAWVNEMTLVQMDEKQVKEYIAAPKYIFTADYGHIYSKPDLASLRMSDAVFLDIMRISYDNGKPAKNGKFLRVTLPSGKEGWVLKKEVEQYDSWKASRKVTAENIIATAKRFVGVTYFWGGTSIKGVDCSGLASMSFRSCGVLLNRNASQQVKMGVEVAYKDAQPGDLLFFGTKATAEKPERISHVAIYLGNDMIIHSSQVVRINSLLPGREDSYEREVLHARRLIGNVEISDFFVSLPDLK